MAESQSGGHAIGAEVDAGRSSQHLGLVTASDSLPTSATTSSDRSCVPSFVSRAVRYCTDCSRPPAATRLSTEDREPEAVAVPPPPEDGTAAATPAHGDERVAASPFEAIVASLPTESVPNPFVNMFASEPSHAPEFSGTSPFGNAPAGSTTNPFERETSEGATPGDSPARAPRTRRRFAVRRQADPSLPRIQMLTGDDQAVGSQHTATRMWPQLAAPPGRSESMGTGSLAFGAPAPVPTFGAPVPTFGAPLPTSGAPVPTSDAPEPFFGAPLPTSGAPLPTFGAPVPTSDAPEPFFGAPLPTSGAPLPTSGAPENGSVDRRVNPVEMSLLLGVRSPVHGDGHAAVPIVGSGTGRAVVQASDVLSTSREGYPIQERVVPTTIQAEARNQVLSSPLFEALKRDEYSVIDMLLGCDGKLPYLDSVDEQGRSALMVASSTGKVGVVKSLLSAGAKTDTLDKAGNSALLLALIGNHRSIVFALLSCSTLGAVDAKDEHGQTAVFIAAWMGQAGMVKSLLAAGADAVIGNSSGMTPLSVAAREGHELVVDVLLQTRGHGNLEAADEEFGQTALWLAAWKGHVGVVERLLDAGASASTKNKAGETPLLVALQEGHREVVQALLASGEYSELEAKDEQGRTALWWAVHRGHAQIVRCLLAIGAKAGTTDSSGMTPLLEALSRGRQPVTNALLAAPRAIDRSLEAKDSSGCTALHVATKLGKIAVVERLIALGANIDTTDSSGMTPLRVALRSGKDDMLRMLTSRNPLRAIGATLNMELLLASAAGRNEAVSRMLAAGANPNAKTAFGATALMLASREGHTGTVACLLDCESQTCNVDATDENGYTAMHEAAKAGRASVVKQLLAAQANTGAKTLLGATPLLLASREGHDEVVEALLLDEHDIDAMDMFGHTALIAACYKGHSRVAVRLVAAGANTEARTPLGESVKGIAHREGMSEVLWVPLGVSSLKQSACA